MDLRNRKLVVPVAALLLLLVPVACDPKPSPPVAMFPDFDKIVINRANAIETWSAWRLVSSKSIRFTRGASVFIGHDGWIIDRGAGAEVIHVDSGSLSISMNAPDGYGYHFERPR